MKKPKIAVLIISSGLAGAENSTYNVLERLIKMGEDVSLLSNREIADYYRSIKGLKVHDLGKRYDRNTLKRIIYRLKVNRSLYKVLKREKFDIISLNLHGSFSAYKKFQKSKVITVLHGTEVKTMQMSKPNLYQRIENFYLNTALKGSDFIISVSNWEADQLPEEYKRKTVVIGNGVDGKKFKPLKTKELSKSILYVGRFIELKGIKELLSVAREIPNYSFLFAGRGPMSSQMSLKNTNNLGFKSKEELVKLYNSADICVFPSYQEGSPNVGLEAMACGKPVIATPLGFSEYIENGKDGIIIPAKDKKALKDAIVKLMDNPKLREKLGKNARKKALKHSWGKVAKQYLEVYKKALAEHKKNPTSS